MIKKSLNELELEERFTYQKRNVFYASDFNIPGTRFQVVYFAPSKDIKVHYHKVGTEMFYITEGEGKIIINKKTISVKPGTCIIIHPYDAHEVYAGKKGLTIAIFKINESIEDIHWGYSKSPKK